MWTPRSAVRPIPANPNLEFDRKQAKSLLDALRRGDADALRRFGAQHPRFMGAPDPAALAMSGALHDAQLVVAREYGFASWPRWKQFVETRRLDLAARAGALLRAACSNDVRKASVLLLAEPPLANYDIFTAAACGEADSVAAALAKDPVAATHPGGPLACEPLLYCCFSRLLRTDKDRAAGIIRAAEILLRAGADPNAYFWHEGDGERWLQSTLYGAAGVANSVELTTLLLDAGATIDAEDKEAIYHACEFPDTACLRLLLSRGNPPLGQVKYCLARALDFEYPEHVAAFLAAGADPNFRVGWHGGRTQLHKAVFNGRSAPIVAQLIDAGGDVNARDVHGTSVLRTAVRIGAHEVIELLRARGAHDESITPEDSARGEPMTLCLAALRDDIKTIDRLLDSGAPIDAPGGPDGTPPLHWAAWRGSFRAVRCLVERGADIHRRNCYGGDALATAVHGSANCFDRNGGISMRPPEEALDAEYPAIVEHLISRGARLPERITCGSDAVQEVLRRHGVPDAE
jgi:ankyrin repeat protein